LTTPTPFTLPRPVGAVLSRLPAYPGSVLLVTAINLALARQLPDDVTALLKDKRLSIRVRDARVGFDFTWNGQRFAPSAPHAQPDLAISANAQDFLLLAQRRQDPDTLFFNRRLVMEGDTELGLVVKNALDALELPVLDPATWSPRRAVALGAGAGRAAAALPAVFHATPMNTPADNDQLLVYSCSGCSSAAQLANHVALQLDRRGVAEMSCIAGVGGDVPKLVRLATSGRPIVALDGCPLVCVKSTLARHGIAPARHYQLHEYGVKKRTHQDFDPAQAAAVLARIETDLQEHPVAPAHA